MLQPRASFFRMVVEWPDPAAIHQLSRFIDDVNPFRPAGIKVVRQIVHRIDPERKREVEPLCKIVGDSDALRERLRLRITDALIHVRLHLPLVQRMRFANVYRQKIGTVFVIGVKLDEVNYLAAKRRSGVAAKNEDEWSLSNSFRKRERGLAIEAVDVEIWCRLPDS